MNYRMLPSGRDHPQHDRCMIATFCIEEDHRLLYRDVDFDYFQQHLGLLVVDPLATVRLKFLCSEAPLLIDSHAIWTMNAMRTTASDAAPRLERASAQCWPRHWRQALE